MQKKPLKVREDANSNLIAYIIFSGILVTVTILMLLYITPLFIDAPTNQLMESSFIDIGNGLSTAIVDVYSFSNMNTESDLKTKVAIPKEILHDDYTISVNQNGSSMTISRGSVSSTIALPGIYESGGGVLSESISSYSFKQIHYTSGGV